MLVEEDAKAIHKIGEKKSGIDEKIFIQMFSERSRAHLVALDSAYNSIYGKELKRVNFFCVLLLSYLPFNMLDMGT